LLLAIFNPVSDCGCFGDALILTNWETFFKNIVLMAFVVLLFEDRNRKYLDHGILYEWSVLLLFFAAAVTFSSWNLRHLPLIDFRPFDIGTDIAAEMAIPEGESVDRYETTLIYRNLESGQTKEFTIQNYPRDTLIWKFVDSESKLVEKGYEPPIHDFALLSPYDEDVTESLLEDEDYSLLLIAHNLEETSHTGLQKAIGWAGLQQIANDFSFYAVTASTRNQINKAMREEGLNYDFHTADEIVLKTIVRSNPGFLLMKNGIILGKWSWGDFPTIEEVDPGWPEMITNATKAIQEEQEILRDAGVIEDFSFDLTMFDQSALKMLFTDIEERGSNRIAIVFILVILLLICFLQVFTRTKKLQN
jgi:hypothetical protein